MAESKLNKKLLQFYKEKKFTNKGSLSVALVITRHAAKDGLPLSPDALLTGRGGQVTGLSGEAVKAILADHGVTQMLAREGGRTSRGSIDNMRSYVEFLNTLHQTDGVELEAIEKFWVDRVKDFFASKPFRLRVDPTKNVRSAVTDILEQARLRQKDSPGVQFMGAILQHLVGAKLELIGAGDNIQHHSFSTADEQTGRGGDFIVGDTAIHVTVSPTEALIEKCADNLSAGLRPLIITTEKGCVVAQELSENKEIGDRVDVFEAEQFLAANVYEHGKFGGDGRREATERFIDLYNNIIEQNETDPSLKIKLG